ncbi:MAG: 5-formyltetrahydrofolate cyclo-ligase [Coriobacteriales bacterium]|jgi:5-formyltetrahydrofolate cyclo-ligase|nr:5-formyltetrahydrofolate cyclo-ligase [Coriobacteriales bacterium]
MQTIAQCKTSLRQETLKRAADLSALALAASNTAVFRHLTKRLALYRQAHTLLCFASLHPEIDTAPIISHALSAGKRVALPVVAGPQHIEARLINSLSELAPGTFRILEPPQKNPLLRPDQIDLALVPGLAFDRNGNRLGRGGGFYDRFLSGRSFSAIALCREALLLPALPTEAWDEPVDMVITEGNIYQRQYPQTV